jgi:branched-subunit amino acid aminotransferase/4-amino-4-deoxychorismate lyase
MGDTEILRWSAGRFAVEEWCDVNPGEVRVADSFLILDGGVVGFDKHLERFTSSVHDYDSGFDAVAFRHGLVDALPKEGAWFPRVESVDYGDGHLVRLLIRPAPNRDTTVSLATAKSDPRRFPRVKGPDLQRLGALRRETDPSAGEVVILDGGTIAEGAWSSIVWWQDGVVHRVSDDVPRLAGVTESVILDRARHLGAPVVDARRIPDQLDGCEVWVLSALHGIRVVTDWIDGPSVSVEPGRAEFWRTVYETQRFMLKL